MRAMMLLYENIFFSFFYFVSSFLLSASIASIDSVDAHHEYSDHAERPNPAMATLATLATLYPLPASIQFTP